MKKVIKYWRVRASKILHLDTVRHKCHYFMRANYFNKKMTSLKRRSDYVCDECQRQQKLMRKK